MTDRGTKALRERKAVFEEITNQISKEPLNLQELRNRLKHIAGLCWGLSIDITNELEERDNLKIENKQQREEIEYLKNKLGLKGQRAETKAKLENMTAKERLDYKQQRANNSVYMQKKYQQKKETISGGLNNAE